MMLALTAMWFKLADILARLLATFALVGAAAYPFIGPAYLRMAQQPTSGLAIAGTCALWLAVAAGAFAFTRRRMAGIFLVLLPAAALAISGQPLAGLLVASGVVVAFWTPFLLALIQARRDPSPGGAA
mgnify:CR=1 FL=1|tara:strand:- start:568 stop:951 length:384 start_codon:yes stop_codon:yes gene_type:complete